MTWQTRSLELGALAAVALLGCSGGDEHPASRGDPNGAQASKVVTAAALEEAEDAGNDGQGIVPSHVCEPGSFRECRYYYHDPYTGQLHCPMSVQFCLPDGTDYLPCGTKPPVAQPR